MSESKWYKYCLENIQEWENQLDTDFISVDCIVELNNKVVASDENLQLLALQELECETVEEIHDKVKF